MSMAKNILITGGAGFIGSHTAVALHLAGLKPIIVDNLSNTSMEMVHGIESIIQEKVVSILTIVAIKFKSNQSLNNTPFMASSILLLLNQ